MRVLIPDLFQSEIEQAVEYMFNKEIERIEDLMSQAAKKENTDKHIGYLNEKFSYDKFREPYFPKMIRYFLKCHNKLTGKKASIDCKFVGIENHDNGNVYFVVDMSQEQYVKWVKIVKDYHKHPGDLFFAIAHGDNELEGKAWKRIFGDVNKLGSVEDFLVGGFKEYDLKLEEIYGKNYNNQ